MSKSLRVVNPFTECVIDEVPYGGRDEAIAALEAVETSLPHWQGLSAENRSRALSMIASDLHRPAIAEPIARLISCETGKRIAEARAEVSFSAAYFEWFAELALDAETKQQGEFVRGMLHRHGPRPLGIVAALTPWNFPVSIPARKLAAALAAGCGVVFKPSDVAPLSSVEFAKVVCRHLPRDVVSTVVGEPVSVGEVWLSDTRVRGLSFTGSTRTGQALASQAAPNMTRCILELGGNAPFVILEDADIESAAALLATAKFRNNGQSCIAANHAWVPRSVLEVVVEAFAHQSEQLLLGDPLEESTTLGPLAVPGDPGRIENLVLDAERRGADVVVSTVDMPDMGYFSRPVMIVDPKPGSRVLIEEIFGPALAIRPYEDVSECISANWQCRHGLAAYVVGSDLAVAQGVAESLDVGIVGVNSATPNTPQVPFGGVKLSGIGYEGGKAGVEDFQSLRTLAIASGR